MQAAIAVILKNICHLVVKANT